MEKYVALLRGINVSGKRKIKMDELTELLKGEGITVIGTYLQSGNVVFTHEKSATNELADRIEKALADFFKEEVPVVVLTKEELEKVYTEVPWKVEGMKGNELYVTFFKNKVKMEETDVAEKCNKEERFRIGERVLYFYCPTGYGKTKLTNNVLERFTGVVATTRNWTTVTELVKLAT